MRRWLLWGLLGLDVILMLLFGGGYIARYIHPRHAWLLQLIAIFLPLLSIAVLGLGVVAAALGKWKLFSVHVVLLVLAFVRLFPFERLSPPPLPGVDELKVVTYNAKAKREEGAVSMSQLLQREHPDLIALQEAPVVFLEGPPYVSGQSHIQPLLKSYETREPSRERERGDYPYKFHQPLFAKTAYINQEQLSIPIQFDTLVAATVTRGQFQWQGQHFIVYNLHLRSFNAEKKDHPGARFKFSPVFWWGRMLAYRKDILIRAEEAEKVRRMIEKEELPIIVCGDFNSTPHNWSYWHLAKGLKDVFNIAGKGSGMTYPSRFPFFRIDYILVSSDWNIFSAYTAKTSFSDHLPLVARVSFVAK